MLTKLSRILLAVSALILILGAVAHTAAFPKAQAVLAGATGVPPFYAGSFRGLWLADSATLLLLGVVFAWTALRPSAVSRPALVLLALIPGATTMLIYRFVGPFFAPHLLLAAVVLAILAALLPGPARPGA